MNESRELVFVDDEYYIHAASSRVDDRTRVLKHGDTFAVFDRFGDIHQLGQGEQGLYHEGTRYLSRLELAMGDGRPLLLNSAVTHGNAAFTADLTNSDLRDDHGKPVPGGELHVQRSKLVWQRACVEQIGITNYAAHAVRLPLEVRFAADYADIFEVRGTERAHRGADQPTELLEDGALLSYRGLDDVVRRTRIVSTVKPNTIDHRHFAFIIELAPGETKRFDLTISCELDEAVAEPRPPFEEARYLAQRTLDGLAQRGCRIYTSNEQFNDWINRSLSDLNILATETEHGLYPYAGIPWYSTVFGRDGLITALQTLWINPDLTRGVLRFLAAHQATAEDIERDAEPGKIVHEMRRSEMATLGEIPFGLYYGSVDATPLFIALCGQYFRQTGDIGLVRSLWPHVEAGLAWIAEYGDKDQDGFVEYLRLSQRGLANQGWKDSFDSVSHADGTLATGAIALCEVQSYVYAAKRAAAQLARALGKNGQGEALQNEARALRQHINEAFWCEELGTYALALDGEKRQCRVRTSNAGHVLYAGAATDSRARRAAATIMAPGSFTGWGVRTLAEAERRYNPMSYHNGSVWPHDTALVAAGFARYGLRRQAMELLRGLFDASLFLEDHRLPELFCGFPRRPHEGPTLYPVACLPQAWASGSVFMLLQACLGLSFNREKPQIRFTHPTLPSFLQWIRLENLQVGNGSVDLMLRRHPKDVSINVVRSVGDIGVAVFLEP